jgi:lipopolysaccharide/colanic/teichoic acid biosynthesis glycosyltransferase
MFYWNRGKRAFDLSLALVAASVLSPVLALLWLLVRARIGDPAFFRQERPGWRSRPFTVLKFRTMTDARDPAGNLLPDAKRLTAFGRWLRRTSLDELPELFNVLNGDMSLVGPRPLLMEYLPRYTPEQARRHEVKPGITGWAQVNGRNAISWEQKFKLDVWYVDHCRLWLDLKILALTVIQVFQRKGISAHDHATMPVFEGSAGNAGSGGAGQPLPTSSSQS